MILHSNNDDGTVDVMTKGYSNNYYYYYNLLRILFADEWKKIVLNNGGPVSKHLARNRGFNLNEHDFRYRPYSCTRDLFQRTRRNVHDMHILLVRFDRPDTDVRNQKYKIGKRKVEVPEEEKGLTTAIEHVP